MKLARIFLALLLAVSISAFPATIPPRLEARAAELRRQASPEILAWVHKRGVALARAKAPVNLRALKQSIRSHIVVKGGLGTAWAAPREGDIEAIAFLVLMDGLGNSNGDLRAIMDQLKAMDTAKANLRLVGLRAPGPPQPPQPVGAYEACRSNTDCHQGQTCVQGGCR
jgi:hypothetical protein